MIGDAADRLERGCSDRGERGHRGEKGDPGDPAKQLICGWKIDAKNFRAVPFGADGKPLPALDLYPLAQAILDLAVNAASDEAREAMKQLSANPLFRQGF